MIHTVTFNITTSSGGAYDSSSAGGVSGQIGSLGPLKLLGVRWRDGDLVDGVDATLSMVQGDSTIVIATLTDANTDAYYSPKNLAATTGGTAATDAFASVVVEGTLKLVVASGGDTKTGNCYVYLSDE